MHLFQVGVGSGGMVVLDLLARESTLDRVTLIDPDLFLPHNVHRHIFPRSSVGRLKVELAAEWLRERQPDLQVMPIAADLTDPSKQDEFRRIAAECDLGVCAADNEPAKYAFDSLMRSHGKPWTLGEVLSGGIGGWVHRFIPGGPCYGCVASHLQRTVVEEPGAPMPDYSNPGGTVVEARVPASKASIQAIASLHALITQEIMTNKKMQLNEQKGDGNSTAFTSLLFTLQAVPGVFEEPYRSYRFAIERRSECLVCSPTAKLKTPLSSEKLDVALDQALDRLLPQ
jgi:molybdopterin/thiamine biosynthesis adenylyltransferase